jgi:hypothetical protein
MVIWLKYGAQTNLKYLRAYFVPILLAWSSFMLTLVGSLLIFHIYLIANGQTTNEFLRGKPGNFSSSGIQHRKRVFDICCFSIQWYPTYISPMWEELTDNYVAAEEEDEVLNILNTIREQIRKNDVL